MSELRAPEWVSVPAKTSGLSSLDGVDQRQLIAAHRSVSGLDHALRFASAPVASSFREMVWLLDGLGAVQLDGEPVWVQTVIDEPTHAGVLRAENYASIASSIAHSPQHTPVTRSMAMRIAQRLSEQSTSHSQAVVLRRDANSNEALQHGLAHWEHGVSDHAGELDSLVMCAIADANFRRLCPFTENNHASAGLLFGALLREEGVLSHAPLCLSHFFSRYATDFKQALNDDKAVVRLYLRAINETATELVRRLDALMLHIDHCQEIIEQTLPRAPVDVVMQVVCRPLCTNADLMDAGISRRQTSSSYLKKLAAAGILNSHPKGKELRYINSGVLSVFSELG